MESVAVEPFGEYLINLSDDIPIEKFKRMVKFAKLLENKPIKTRESEKFEQPSDLFEALRSHGLISEHDGKVLVSLLEKADCMDIATKVEARFARGFTGGTSTPPQRTACSQEPSMSQAIDNSLPEKISPKPDEESMTEEEEVAYAMKLSLTPQSKNSSTPANDFPHDETKAMSKRRTMTGRKRFARKITGTMSSEVIPKRRAMTGRELLTGKITGTVSNEVIPKRTAMTRRELVTGKITGTVSNEEIRPEITLSGPVHEKSFSYPQGLLFIGNLLAVCDTGNKIVRVMNKFYVCELQLGSFDDQFPKPFKPVNLAFSQHYFILDNGNLQVVVCDGKNTIITFISLPGDAVCPKGIALLNEFILVCDPMGLKVVKLARNGQIVGELKVGCPQYVVANSKGAIIVTDHAPSSVMCFDSSLNSESCVRYCNFGNDDGQVLSPRGIDVDENDNVYICDYNNHRIVKLRSNGNWECNLFRVRVPEYISVADDGRIAITCNNTVEIYRPR